MKKKDINIKEKNYFRSVEQLENSDEVKQFVEREFPQGASEMNNDWSRRNFLTLMGASMALAGLAASRACRAAASASPRANASSACSNW